MVTTKRRATKARASAKSDASANLRSHTDSRKAKAKAKAKNLAPQPLDRVLVPIDFSKTSDAVTDRAIRLPLAERATIELLSVVPSEVTGALRVRVAKDLERRLEQAASKMKRAARNLGKPGIVVSTHIATGEPFVEIVRRSRAMEAELILLGRHGRRPFRDLLIGSTATKVVRHSDLPVLVVSGSASEPYQRPLLATALDDASGRTLAFLHRLLPPTTSSGTIVHAFNAPFAGFVAPSFSSRERIEWEAHFRREAEAGLRAFLAGRNQPPFDWTQVLRRGDPRVIIQSEIVRRRADVVALGTHARTGVAHALVGSVAEWVMAEAECDVLIARPMRFSFELV